MRGKVWAALWPRSPNRITPAHAGKRRPSSQKAGLPRDHPRTCGEKTFTVKNVPGAEGSPPHMRGKGNVQGPELSTARITPAHAGKSRCHTLRFSRWWDHPRTCGEKMHMLLCVPAAYGITPAHAGKRKPAPDERSILEDHPRTCGEKLARFSERMGKKGSPPHMRGKVNLSQKPMRGGRITPAHAGKSTSHRVCRIHSVDHPRTCGEKSNPGVVSTGLSGSPPHMRGKARQWPKEQVWFRITPAHAGKRRPSSQKAGLPRDHPRTCGEKTFTVKNVPGAEGSPPHMRGKVLHIVSAVSTAWITPAHAGKRAIQE